MIPAHELQVQAVHEECPAWECGSVRFARKVLLALNVRWHWSNVPRTPAATSVSKCIGSQVVYRDNMALFFYIYI